MNIQQLREEKSKGCGITFRVPNKYKTRQIIRICKFFKCPSCQAQLSLLDEVEEMIKKNIDLWEFTNILRSFDCPKPNNTMDYLKEELNQSLLGGLKAKEVGE